VTGDRPGGAPPAPAGSWRHPADPEDRLPVVVAVAAAVLLQLSVPARLGLDPRWLVPALEVVLVATLVGLRLPGTPSSARAERSLRLLLVAAITADNAWSAVLLDHSILTGQHVAANALHLLTTGGAVYATNVIAFGIWYWELDRGGPDARAAGERDRPDFLFPQMTLDAGLVPAGWRPQFGDYLFVAWTNVVAFSPTDTMPLTRWAKALMTAQAAVALTTTALVVARAVNILQ